MIDVTARAGSAASRVGELDGLGESRAGSRHPVDEAEAVPSSAVTARPSRSSSRAGPIPIRRGSARRASGPRHQAEPHLGQAEPRLGIGDDEVADERHLEPAAHRGSLDGRDDGLGDRLDEPERPPARSDVILDRAVTVEQALELGEVGACHEGLVARHR